MHTVTGFPLTVDCVGGHPHLCLRAALWQCTLILSAATTMVRADSRMQENVYLLQRLEGSCTCSP